MKALIVADNPSSYLWDHFPKEELSDIELVLSCGDLPSEYLSFLVTMLPVKLFYVTGNHDTAYAVNPPEGCICIDNRLIVHKGIRILGFGGSKSPQNKPGHHTEARMRKMVNRRGLDIMLNRGFDILMTHAPARGLGDGTDKNHEGFDVYRKLIERYQPAYHFHGHQHKNYNVLQPNTHTCGITQIINADGYKIVDININK